jgi:uncharacterized protein YjiS (DUF1127 family)
MSTTHIKLARPAVLDAERNLKAVLSPLFRKIADWRIYRHAVRELRALSVRQREDIGLAGLDMAAIARKATLAR